MLLPLSAPGHPAVVAKGLKQAGELAIFEVNNPGFRLVVKDTRGTPEGAAAAATTALSQGAELILGPLFAKSVTSVSAVARQANVPVIAFSNDQRVAGNGTYLLSFLAREEVRRIVSFAATQGRRQFAALIPDNAYGSVVEPTFRAAVAEAGGVVTALVRYPAKTGGVFEPARKLIEDIKGTDGAAGVPVDALYLPGGPAVLSNLNSIIASTALDVQRIKLLGSSGWDYANISREASLVGGWYPATDPRNWQAFAQKFTQTYGSAPPRIASLAHNAVTMAARLASQNPRGARFTAANLTNPNGFAGVDGIVRLTPQGLAQRGLAVLEVQKFGPQLLSPAPQRFGARVASRVN